MVIEGIKETFVVLYDGALPEEVLAREWDEKHQMYTFFYIVFFDGIYYNRDGIGC